MKKTDIRLHRRLQGELNIGVAAAFNPGTIRTVFANSKINAEEEP
jgi:hypothetical protein